jgi:hypothetical protein
VFTQDSPPLSVSKRPLQTICCPAHLFYRQAETTRESDAETSKSENLANAAAEAPNGRPRDPPESFHKTSGQVRTTRTGVDRSCGCPNLRNQSARRECRPDFIRINAALHVLVLDDCLLPPLKDAERRDLLEILDDHDDHYEKAVHRDREPASDR